LHEYFPKRAPLENVTQKQVDKAVSEINHRLRKRIEYLSPYETFYGKSTKIATG
jgi:IS30 family transposase